jgi:hypothetical protein
VNPQDFKSDRAGRVVKTISGYWAFVPAPLPPVIEYNSELSLLLSQADAALGELSGVGRVLPNPDLLIAPYIRREAVASSRIEGTQADLSALLRDEVEPKQTPRRSDVQEVRNYVAAMNLGIKKLDQLPLAGRLARPACRPASGRARTGKDPWRISPEPELDRTAGLHAQRRDLRPTAARS